MKLRNIVVGLLFSAAAGMTLRAMQPVEYTMITNCESVLWQSCKSLSCIRAFKVLMSQGILKETTSTVCINNVPARAGGPTVLTLMLTLRKNVLYITVRDASNHCCIRGHLSKEGASLDNITAAPGTGDETRLVTGKILMQLWEALWIGCNVPYCRLLDSSRFDGFYLSILLPLIQGHSWYGSMGYIPELVSAQEYADAIRLLRACPCDTIKTYYGDDSVIAKLLERTCALCNLKLSSSFGELIATVYAAWRSHAGTDRATVYKQHLLDLYTECLVDCPLGPVCSESIQWQSILTKNIMCVKMHPQAPKES